MTHINIINKLVADRITRNEQIRTAIYDLLHIIGSIESENTTYLIYDTSAQRWEFERLYLSDDNTIKVDVVQSDEQGPISGPVTVDLDSLDLENILSIIHSILEEMELEYEESDALVQNDLSNRPKESEEDLRVFLYPVDEFDRNISNDEIIAAYQSKNNHEREFPVEKLTPEEFACFVNDDGFSYQQQWIRFIKL